jgi:hypothetical protein
MPQNIQDWLNSIFGYLKPEPTPHLRIQSGRDWLDLPPVSGGFLEFLHKLEEGSITVSLPFRIIWAWPCQEADGKDIYYIEAIMPLKEDMFPEVHISEEKFIALGKYKIARFLVEDHEVLLELQKNYFGLS